MSYSDFEFLIHLYGGKISVGGGDTAFRKAVSFQERLVLSLRFLESGDSYVSLQYLLLSFQANNQLNRSRSVCEALGEKRKDYTQVRQIFVFVFCERSLKIYFNRAFCLKTTLLKHFY